MRNTKNESGQEEFQWFRYWSKHKPVKRGWEVVDDLASCHHGEYAVLLRRKPRKCAKK